MRETCARITDKAEDANFLARPFMLMLAELLCRIFGKIEDLVLLWRAGLIPPPAPKPPRPHHARAKTRTRLRHRRTNRRTPGLRLCQAPHRAATRPFGIPRSTPQPRRHILVRRIDRYPKSRKNPSNQCCKRLA
jgi:hypothetical protein